MVVPDPPGVDVIHVETAAEMLAAARNALPADIAIFAAAVADWRVETAKDQKIKKASDARTPVLKLAENPDILKTIAAKGPQRPRLVVGFAAETENVTAFAQRKLKSKNADWIVANDVSPHTGIMGGELNTVHLVSRDGIEDWPEMGKAEVAEALVQRIAATLGAHEDAAQ